jgi:SAM-dependent methyltransferase
LKKKSAIFDLKSQIKSFAFRKKKSCGNSETYMLTEKCIALGDTRSTFKRKGWYTADLVDADFVVDLRKETLPFLDSTLMAVHSSHVIEHITYSSGLQLFKEVYRCLKPGGCFRISTPDMDLLLERYEAEDWSFFLQADGSFILSQICEGKLLPESLLMHNRLVGWFASYSGRLDSAGGPIVDRSLVNEKLSSLSKYEFRDWCVSLLEPNRIYAHIHLYDYEELFLSLKLAGFRNIEKSFFGESNSSFMLAPPIDLERHKTYSLYIEAVK